MPVEPIVNYIEDFNETWPNDNPDKLAKQAEHSRNIKKGTKGSFPNLGQAAVTKTATEINDLSTLSGSESLTNKTLDSPVINTATINTPQIDFVVDSNANEVLKYSAVASAVNYVDIVNASTGNPARVNANGDNTDVGLRLGGKGTGIVDFGSPVTLPDNTVTTQSVASGAITNAKVAENAVRFSSEMWNAAATYDFSIGTSNNTQVIPAGVYLAGTFVSGSSLTGIFYIEYFINSAWIVNYSQSISSGATSDFGDLIVSDGIAVRMRWAFSLGTGSTTLRSKRIFN